MPNELVPGILRRTLAVLILLSVIPMGLVPEISQDASAYTPHAPILINGNGDFTAANGVTAGSGTPADPYVIEGWEIESFSEAGIRIENTDAHFIVRGVHLLAAPWDYYRESTAIVLLNVTYGSLEDSLLENTDLSSYVVRSESITLEGNVIRGRSIHIDAGSDYRIVGNSFTDSGLEAAWNARNISVSGNNFTGRGIGLSSPINATVSDNRFTMAGIGVDETSSGWPPPMSGHYTGPAQDVEIQANRISDSGYGIVIDGELMFLDQPGKVNVTDNILTACYVGIFLGGNIATVTVRDNYIANSSTGLQAMIGGFGTVVSNTFRSNGRGVDLYMSGGLGFHHDNFIDNTVQAIFNNSVGDWWDNGYPRGGNYWSDYTGPDECSGPNQDVCPNPDGMGDVPRIIDGDAPGMPARQTKDRYPLMAPNNLDLPPHPPGMLPAQLAGASLSDVRLVWGLSRDDGSGAKDVARYEVWWGDTFDPLGASYTLLASLPPGSTTYLHSGAGAGDPSSHFYQVRAVDTGNQSTSAVEQAGKHAQFLSAGQNLLSVPMEQANWTVGAVLQTVPWIRAWSLGSGTSASQQWLLNDPRKTLSTLKVLDLENAFWVGIEADAVWITAGLLRTSTQIALHSGWNLIGYPSSIPRIVSDVLAGVAYDTVEGYADDPPYYLRTYDASDTMEAGMGYWILVPADTSLFISN